MPAFPHRLSLWTWLLPLPFLHLATWLALASQFSAGTALWYPPFALALVFALWWGPRVLLAVYCNILLSTPLWGLEWQWAALYALPETLGVALAWVLLRLRPFDPSLPDLNHLLRFVLLGVLLPVLPMALGVQGNLWLLGHAPLADVPAGSMTLWLADSLTVLGVSIPLLVYLTPWMRRRGWLATSALSGAQHVPEILRQLPPWPLLLLLLAGMPWLLGALPLSLNMPLIGVMTLGLALVWGIAGGLCGAALSVFLVLILPLLNGMADTAAWIDPERLELHFNVLLFMLASLLVGRSISDLRQALASSAQIQQQLALANLAFEASPLGVIIADARQPSLPMIYCNPAFEQVTGYSREEILGKNWGFLLGADQQQQALSRLRKAVRQGTGCDVVLRSYRKNGEPFWSELTLAPMRDEQGISHYVAIQSDVTAREQLASKVHAQREELLKQSFLFSQTEHIANLGGWVLNMPQKTMNWSPGCFRIYELDPRNGTPDLQETLSYLDASGRVLAEQILQQLVDGLEHFDIEVRLLTAKGKARWLRIRGVSERDGAELVRVYGALQDVSARKHAEQQLRDRDEHLRLFFEAPLIGMALTSQNFAWEEVNHKLCSILGRSRDELMSCSWESLSLQEDLLSEQPLLDQVLNGEREGFELEKCFRHADGSLVHTRVSLRAVRHSSGRVLMFLLLVEDVSQRLQAEARYRTIVENAPEAIMLYDVNGKLVECNDNALRLLRYSREELADKHSYELSPNKQADGQLTIDAGKVYYDRVIAGDAPVFDWLMRDSKGRQIPCEVRLVLMPGEPVIRCSITDISDRQRYQREIERLAFSDELTGLPNRRLLLDRLQHAMDRELRERTLGALLFIDLDHFKTVNDSLGHLVGDGLLREVSVRLASGLRAEDTLARMGGDEFVVLLEGLDSNPQLAAKAAAITAEKLLKSLLGSCWVDGHELTISASIGIALHPFGNEVAADVLKQADTAMYQAKQGGRNALHFFAPEMQAAIDQRLQLQNDLRQAVQRGQLHVVFQPQISLASARIAGAEVLLRWVHPERGEITPDDFIPLAEETGLIEELGVWVLEQACAALARWLPQWPQLVLAVNLSPRELRQPGCVKRVSECLQRHQVPASALELEITEGVLVEDVELCISNMQALKALGIRFAIDDFGTGYSSLTYLKRLPLDRLKIDRSFTWDMDGEDGSGLMMVQTILMIAHNLGLECIAEGIESSQQLDYLREHGCSLGQGYYFSRPLTEVDFIHWVAQHLDPQLQAQASAQLQL